MEEARRQAVDVSLGSALTRAPVDNARATAAIRGAVTTAERIEVRSMVLAKRRHWLDWLTVTQRKWQRETRRPSRARHHDSISIREHYVRARG